MNTIGYKVGDDRPFKQLQNILLKNIDILWNQHKSGRLCCRTISHMEMINIKSTEYSAYLHKR